MKQLHAIYAFLCLGTLFTAVSCTDTVTGEPCTGTRSIAFTPAAETRAAVEGNALPADFKVWGGYDNNATNVFYGVTVQSPNWTYTGGIQYWIPGKTYNFYGVYPASVNASCATDGTLTVSGFDCSATGNAAVDLMTATYTRILSNPIKDNETSAVTLTFNHELARINIIVTSEGDAVTISNAQLYGISHKGTLNGSNWELSPVSDKVAPSFTEQTLNINDTKDHLLFGGDLLLPPHNPLSDNATLDFSYQYTTGDTASKSASIKLKTNSVITWEKGKRYNYRINIPRNATDVNLTVEVANWDEKNYTVEW